MRIRNVILLDYQIMIMNITAFFIFLVLIISILAIFSIISHNFSPTLTQNLTTSTASTLKTLNQTTSTTTTLKIQTTFTSTTRPSSEGGGGGGGGNGGTTTTSTTSLTPSSSTITSTTISSSSSSSTTTTIPARSESFQKGINFVSFGIKFSNPSEAIQKLEDLKNTNTEWVAFVATWYQDNLTSTYIRNTSATPTDQYLNTMIANAKQLGFKTVLKPHLGILDGTYKGNIKPGGGTKWHEWFDNYRNFIYHYADLAEQNNVDMLTVGVELTSSQSKESEWRDTISGVRQRFSGKITYGPQQGNDAYKNVSWWDALDYAAVDAYFPLTNKCDPTFDELKAGWQTHLTDLRNWQASINKPVIFTEIGDSYYNCSNIKPGSTEPNSKLNPLGVVDLQEQRDVYEATFQTFYNEPWLVGMYWFTWDGNPSRPNSLPFAINNNPARDVLTNWYAKNW